MDIDSRELDDVYSDGLITGGCGEVPDPPIVSKYHRWAYSSGYLAGVTIRNQKKNRES